MTYEYLAYPIRIGNPGEEVACVIEINMKEGKVGIRSFSVCTQTAAAMNTIQRNLGNAKGFGNGMPHDHNKVHEEMGELNNMSQDRHYHFCRKGADWKDSLAYLGVLSKKGLVHSGYSNKLASYFIQFQRGG